MNCTFQREQCNGEGAKQVQGPYLPLVVNAFVESKEYFVPRPNKPLALGRELRCALFPPVKGTFGARKDMKKDIIAAHRYCSNHRESVLDSDLGGCFYCLSIFSPSEIKDWVDARQDETDINESGQTALCPRCGIDSTP
jgi:hypothetical protein